MCFISMTFIATISSKYGEFWYLSEYSFPYRLLRSFLAPSFHQKTENNDRFSSFACIRGKPLRKAIHFQVKADWVLKGWIFYLILGVTHFFWRIGYFIGEGRRISLNTQSLYSCLIKSFFLICNLQKNNVSAKLSLKY